MGANAIKLFWVTRFVRWLHGEQANSLRTISVPEIYVCLPFNHLAWLAPQESFTVYSDGFCETNPHSRL